MTKRWISTLLVGAAALLGRGTAARGQEEAPAAVLDGDPALVAEVSGDLGRRGVTTGGGEGEAVHVHLRRAAGGIEVVAGDEAAGRVVSTPDTAAALIESWTRREIAAPLLAPRAPVVPPAQVPPELAAAAAAPVVASPVSRWTPVLRVDGETSAGWDHSSWFGTSAGACARLGSACLGFEARLALRLDDGREIDEWPLRRRPELLAPEPPALDWQGLLRAEWAVPLGRPVLALGLGAGVGRRDEGSGAGPVGWRGEARASLLFPLGRRLAVELGLRGATGLGSERDPRTGLVTRGASPVRVGFGLRWGLP